MHSATFPHHPSKALPMRIAISIPKPCHEDWNAMRSEGAGRHCATCSYVVEDLSCRTDVELLHRAQQGTLPKCGRFNAGQLDRVLGATGLSASALLLSAPLAAKEQEIKSTVPITIDLEGVWHEMHFVAGEFALVPPEQTLVGFTTMRCAPGQLPWDTPEPTDPRPAGPSVEAGGAPQPPSPPTVPPIGEAVLPWTARLRRFLIRT